MYRVPTKNNPKKLPPNSSPAVFAPARVRSRKIESGKSGDSTWFSITKNVMKTVTSGVGSSLEDVPV